MLDVSGSIRPERFPVIQDYLINVLKGWTIGPDDMRVGVLIYSNAAQVIFNLNTYDNMEDTLQVGITFPFLAAQ